MSHAAQPPGPPEPPPHELEWLAWLLLQSLPARFPAGQDKQQQGVEIPNSRGSQGKMQLGTKTRSQDRTGLATMVLG